MRKIFLCAPFTANRTGTAINITSTTTTSISTSSTSSSRQRRVSSDHSNNSSTQNITKNWPAAAGAAGAAGAASASGATGATVTTGATVAAGVNGGPDPIPANPTEAFDRIVYSAFNYDRSPGSYAFQTKLNTKL
jgi:hypothetical protein